MKLIPLTQGKFAMVDDEDYEWLNQWKWHYHSKGYAARSVKISKRVKLILMHRIIIKNCDSFLIDHIDRNRLNNKKENLRICTRSENYFNAIKHFDNRRGFKGVNFNLRHKKWYARIQFYKKRLWLGHYTTKEGAARAYNKAALKYHG